MTRRPNRPPRPENGVVGYVPGVFDMFHIGHLRILERSAERCDWLIAGVVSDSVALRAKNKRPIVPLEERLEIVASIDCVDAVVEDISMDKRVVWEMTRFDRIFKGDDWRGTPKGDQLAAAMDEVGAELIYLPYTGSVSSTAIRHRVAAREGAFRG